MSYVFYLVVLKLQICHHHVMLKCLCQKVSRILSCCVEHSNFILQLNSRDSKLCDDMTLHFLSLLKYLLYTIFQYIARVLVEERNHCMSYLYK